MRNAKGYCGTQSVNMHIFARICGLYLKCYFASNPHRKIICAQVITDSTSVSYYRGGIEDVRTALETQMSSSALESSKNSRRWQVEAGYPVQDIDDLPGGGDSAFLTLISRAFHQVSSLPVQISQKKSNCPQRRP